ncbi:MAG: hypothetical protein KDD50_02110 [Bdellovibrionales bacterium]|nr:hypothetical protein [Bdellovibrionales bacterium]
MKQKITICIAAMITFFSLHSSAMSRGPQFREDPPFPWQLCEIDVNKIFGSWMALEFDGRLIFSLVIEQKSTVDREQKVISISQYNSERERIGRGIGIVMHDKKSLLGAMRAVNGEEKDYWVYVKTFCEEQSGQQNTYLELINANSESDKNMYLLKRQERSDYDSYVSTW